MFKFLVVFMLFFSSLVADEVKWASDFKSGIAQATKEHKPVLFISSRHTCKYCVLLNNTTLKDKTVVKALQRDFISIIAYSDDGDYMPKRLWRPGTPAIWFLDSYGEPMFQPIPGAIDAENFLNALAIVKEEFDNKN